MLFDTSYHDKRIERQINDLAGKPFSLRERLKLRGIGSKRMVIQEISAAYQKYMNPDHYQSKANLELRPYGLIIHFRHKLQSYSWVMPYSQVEIKNEDHLFLGSNEKFIQFKDKLEAGFLDKIHRVMSSSK